MYESYVCMYESKYFSLLEYAGASGTSGTCWHFAICSQTKLIRLMFIGATVTDKVWHSQCEETSEFWNLFNAGWAFYWCGVDSWTWLVVKHLHFKKKTDFPDLIHNSATATSDCFAYIQNLFFSVLLDIASSLLPQYLQPGNVWHQRLQRSD